MVIVPNPWNSLSISERLQCPRKSLLFCIGEGLAVKAFHLLIQGWSPRSGQMLY